MSAYVKFRINDTSFTDLVPHIIANALLINIIIVTKTGYHEYALSHVPCMRTNTMNNVMIYKVDSHYGGIKPVPIYIENNRRKAVDNDISEYEIISELNEITGNHIELLSLNVCGLSKWKLDDDIFGSYFKKYDTILLQETWSAEGDEYLLDGYVSITFQGNIDTNCFCATQVDWVFLLTIDLRKV